MNIKNQDSGSIRVASGQIISAIMFLSRLPLNRLAEIFSVDSGKLRFDETARYFGIAAIVIAFPAAAILSIMIVLGFSSFAAASLSMVVFVLTTGALHEDALADVADGFGGGADKKRKIEIMRDSQIGTYGATSLILSILLYLAFLVQIISSTNLLSAGLILIAANVASTSAMVWPWANMPPARDNGGLSSSHGVPSQETATMAGIIGFSIAFVLLGISIGIIVAVLALAFCAGSVFLFSIYCRKQIGGHTGDTLGATKKISELCLLFALIIAT